MKWVDADDDKGMSFQGLQQNTFTLQMCFPYCREKTGVSNPQTAGKYFVGNSVQGAERVHRCGAA